MSEQETTTSRRGRGRGTAAAAQQGVVQDVAQPDAGQAAVEAGGEAVPAEEISPMADGLEPTGAGAEELVPHGADGGPGETEEHADIGEEELVPDDTDAPVHHSAGYGAMSAGGAPPSGMSTRSYSGGTSAPATRYSGGGYGRNGYGRSGNGSRNAGGRSHPSDYQVREISARRIPVPPTYEEAQALLDSFEPTAAQLKRLNENGLTAATRGEAKDVLAKLVRENPGLEAQWQSENATARVEQRQLERSEQAPTAITGPMFDLLARNGVKDIPTDYATAAAMIDRLPPSENMVRALREHGRAVPATRAEAIEIIRRLPATPDQITTIMRRTGGRWAPTTRAEADRWFRENSRDRAGQPGMVAA